MKKPRSIQFPILLMSLSFGFLSFVLPIYAQAIHLSPLEIGGLFSIVSLVNMILKLFIGKIIDQHGLKKMLIIASLIISISLILYAFSSDKVVLYMARVIHAIGSTLLGITIYSISIGEEIDENMGIRLGTLDAAMNRGGLYGAFIGFGCLLYFSLLDGWSYIFLFYGACSIFAFLYILNNMKETKIEVNKEVIEKVKITNLYIILLLIVFLTSITNSMMNPIFIIFLKEYVSSDIGMLALAFVPASIIYSTFPVKAGKYVDRYGKKQMLLLGNIIGIIMIIFILKINTLGMLILVWSIEAVGITLSSISYRLMIRVVCSRDTIGQNFGIFLIFSSLGAIIGPLFGGFLYDLYTLLPFYIILLFKILNLLIIIKFIPKVIKKTI